MREEPLYKPSPWGQKFHSLSVDEALGAGSAGPGKTTVLLADPMEQIVTEAARCISKFDPKHPAFGPKMVQLVADAKVYDRSELERELLEQGLPFEPREYRPLSDAEAWEKWCYHPPGSSTGWALHVRRTRTMLDQSIEKFLRLYRRIDPQMHWDSTRAIGKFSSGYHFQFGHMKDPLDYEQYFSSEFSHLAFDELVQFLENQYDQLRTRVRSSDWILRRMLKVRAMSNPVLTHEGHDFTVDPYWVRKRFVDAEPQGNKIFRRRIKMEDGTSEFVTRVYLPAKLSDNPDAGFRRDYEKRLKDQKPHIKKALFDGDWYTVAGGFFADSWIMNIHVCEPFTIPTEWPVFRSMDWGFKVCGVVYWAALDPENTLFVFREYTFKGKTATQVAQRVKDIEEDEGLWGDNGKSSIRGWADTQLWEKRGEQGKSKFEEFVALGVTWEPADKASKRRNCERLLERLNSHESGSSTPGIVYFSCCRNAIRTIPSMPTDSKDPELPMDGGDDHWLDASLYLVAGVSRTDPKASYSDEDDDEDPTPEGSGGDGYGGS